MAGIFYGWIGIYYANMAQMQDTWSYHFSSLEETKLLFTNPHEYFMNLFHNPYEEGGIKKFFESDNSYWNDLKGIFFVKILSLFNIFSFGHYYTNVIFYSFISMFGPVAIFRVMNDVFPGKKWQVLAGTFLIPSFLYWTSGLHKEGLIFLGFSLVIFTVYFALKNKKIPVGKIFIILVGLLLVLILRNFLIVVLLPALIAWLLATKFPKKGLRVFAACYTVFIILFFTAKYIHPDLNFPSAVVKKQKEFTALLGNSSVPTKKLEPTFTSFIINSPQAITLATIRPYPSDVRHILSLAAATEINFLLLLFLVFLFFRKNGSTSRLFIYFCLFLSFSILLTIGYTVNNIGAIVRYRSIVFPFLMVPLFCGIDWERIYNLFFNNIKNKNNVTKISGLTP